MKLAGLICAIMCIVAGAVLLCASFVDNRLHIAVMFLLTSFTAFIGAAIIALLTAILCILDEKKYHDD